MDEGNLSRPGGGFWRPNLRKLSLLGKAAAARLSWLGPILRN